MSEKISSSWIYFFFLRLVLTICTDCTVCRCALEWNQSDGEQEDEMGSEKERGFEERERGGLMEREGGG